MSRPRTPSAVASTTGADIKDPQRYRGRGNPKVGPLGDPPKRLTKEQKSAWLEIASEIPWLGRSDRKILELAARLTARMATDDANEMGVNAMAQLRMCLQTMGGTPAERTKVMVPDEGEDDPAAQFLN